MSELLSALELARSSYFYHHARLRLGDKYADMRGTIAEIFNENRHSYGYRRVHAVLQRQGIVVSEKVVRRLMTQEQLVVYQRRRRRCSSYCGEIAHAPENLLARDFHADAPNQKWLTDITEFQLPTGKVYLSPVVDCFDGKVNTTVEEFMQELDAYIRWYNQHRIKLSLGALSPSEYRQRLGIAT